MTAFPGILPFDGGDLTAASHAAWLDALHGATQELIGGKAGSALTIAAGSILPTGAIHTVDTEALAAADDLSHIDLTNMPDGRLILLYPVDATRVVTIKHALGGAGEILTADGGDVVLDATMKWFLGRANAAGKVEEVARGFAGDKVAGRAHLGLGSAAIASTGLAAGDVPLAETVIAQGLHTIGIPAAAMTPNVTGGCGALGVLETAANAVNLPNLPFAAALVEKASFVFPAPKGAKEAAGFTLRDLVWSHPATITTFGVRWTARMVALSDLQAADTAFGAAVAVEDMGGAADTLYMAPVSTAITPGGVWAAGDLMVLEIARDGAHANDTLTVDARLHGLKLMMTIDAQTDA